MKKYVLLIAVAMLCAATFGQFEVMQNVFENTDFQPNYTKGSWVEYQLTDKDGEVNTLKFAVLNVDPEGKEPFVFESKITDAEGEWTITQFAAKDPLDRNSFSYMITQRKGDEPRKIKMGELNQMMKTEIEKNEGEQEDVTIATEENVAVEVPAGEFETVRVTVSNEDMTSDIWFSEEIVPFGMVKAEQKGEGKLELIAFGNDAKSEIEGKVIELNLPNLQNLMGGTKSAE